MKLRSLLLLLHLSTQASSAQQPAGMLPYLPMVIEDKKGNEWYIEQNGGLQRNGSQPSMLGNVMTLQLGSQQFYSQQPMISADGRELVLTSPQPLNGLNVTRRITVLEREGALRYVEEFANISGRDLSFSAELRHNFNTQSKGLLSDTGRPLKDGLQSGEFGLLALASQEEKAPSVLLSLCAPGAQFLPRISVRSGYQFSVQYSLSVPAGQTVTLIHAIAQTTMAPAHKPEEVVKAFQSLSMRNLTKGLAKELIKGAANIGRSARGHGLDDWFPAKYWGVAPEASDLLLVDDASRLKGRHLIQPAVLVTHFGQVEAAWENIAALAGPAYTQTDQSSLWMRDGQRWNGVLNPGGVKFALTAGAELHLPRLNRLVLRRPIERSPERQPAHALLETWSGDRIAFEEVGHLKVATPWGSLEAPWAEVISLAAPDPGGLGGMLHLADGTRLRVLPVSHREQLKTKSFGIQDFDFGQLRRAITPQAAKSSGDDTEPTVSFLELAGEQRLVCRVTSALVRFLTQSGPIDLAPATIREMRESGDEATAPRQFQADLWGGGTVIGSLGDSQISVEGRGLTWTLPTTHLARLVNPIPLADNALLRRTGELIQALGDAQWKTRENATAELRELGLLAKTSLQEALKQGTDPEVTRRIEMLLSELE